jgi:hypothetical protein
MQKYHFWSIGDMSNKTPSARDAAEVTHGFESRGYQLNYIRFN